MSQMAMVRNFHPDGCSVSPALEAGRDAAIFRSLFDRSGACMVVVDCALQVQEANAQFVERRAGAGDPVGRTLLDFLDGEDHVRLRRLFASLAESRRDRLVERAGWTGGRLDVPCLLTAVAVHGAVPIVSHIIVTLQFDEPDSAPGSPPQKLLSDLDARILEGIAVGASTINLATKHRLSRQGVEYHIGAMLKRFRASNRAALASRAFALGVFSGPSWPPQVDAKFIK